jgi:8-oxo-dGTP diphosphatase
MPGPSPRGASRIPLVPASYVLLRRGDEVLLNLRQGTGYLDGHWALPAGHVEAGETFVQAAVREVREEAGVEVSPEDLRPLTTMQRLVHGGPPIDQRVDVFFEVRRWTGEPRNAEPAKAARIAWWPLTALPEPVMPFELEVLRRLDDLPPLLLWETSR